MKTIGFLKHRKFVLALLFATTASGYAVSQDIDIDGLRTLANSGDVVAQRELGEALVYGIGGVEKDASAGLGLWEQAAAAGDAQAQTNLGIERLWGINSDPDPKAAQALLEAAAQSGNAQAARILGEGLIGGWVMQRDSATGVRLLEQAVQSGDAQAKVTLGTFYLYGDGLAQDTARAADLFESAAEDGNGDGLEQLGARLMWEQLDASQAETYLRQAGALGRVSAWETLAEGAMYGYLGPSRGVKFAEFAQNARALGSTRIEVLDAQRQMWGISMRASGPGTIEKLETAAAQGNKDAAKFLISLVRDGNQMNIRKQPSRASAYIEKHADLLSPAEAAQLKLSVLAARATTTDEYNSVYEQFRNWDGAVPDELAKEVFDANPNLSLYLLQKTMKSQGTYKGRVNGLATKATLRAVVNGCKANRIRRNCSKSVVDADVIGPLLARQFR